MIHCQSLGFWPVIRGGLARIAAAVLWLAAWNAESGRVMANGVAEDVAPVFTGISEGLGLMDVVIDAPVGAVMGAAVEFGGAGEAATRRVEMVMVRRFERPTADGVRLLEIERWQARLHVPGAAALQVGVRATLADGGERTWPARRVATAAEPAHHTPDWAKGAVWYQIFPERFDNANRANDPRGVGVFDPGWSSPWERVSVDELEAARARAAGRWPPASLDPARMGGALYNVVFQRRYGGDLQGVVRRLEHVADLGVDAIYLTPIFRAPSLHKYDAADYRHVDETFAAAGDPTPESPPGKTADPATWGWTAADRYVLDTLLPAIRRHGMRVIFDGVWNHVGREHWAFRDVLEHGRSSPYAEWFDGTFFEPKPGEAVPENMAHLKPGTLISWRAWNERNGDLPVFKQTPGRDLAAGPKAHVFEVTKRWTAPDGDPSRGVDGWRLDVAADLGVAFWRDWRALVKSIKPEAALFGELWFPGERFFGGEGFDGQMNYPMAVPVTRWLGVDPAFTSAQLARALEQVFVNHPATDLVQMNLLASHDTDRLASMLNNPGLAYDSGAGPRTSAAYRAERPPALVYELVELAVALQATYLGAPMVYAGDEWGMFGADDPDCRKPVPWPDLGPREDASENADPKIRDAFRRWLRLRKDPALGPVLKYGLVRHLATNDPAVFAFERRLHERRVVVVINRGETGYDAGALIEGVGGPAAWVPARTAIYLASR